MAWTAKIEGGVVQLRSAPSGGQTVSIPARGALEVSAAIDAIRPDLVAIVRDEANRQAREVVADFVRNTNMLVAGRQEESAGYWLLPVAQEHLAEVVAYKRPDKTDTDAAGLLAAYYGPVKVVRVTDPLP